MHTGWKLELCYRPVDHSNATNKSNDTTTPLEKQRERITPTPTPSEVRFQHDQTSMIPIVVDEPTSERYLLFWRNEACQGQEF